MWAYQRRMIAWQAPATIPGGCGDVQPCRDVVTSTTLTEMTSIRDLHICCQLRLEAMPYCASVDATIVTTLHLRHAIWPGLACMARVHAQPHDRVLTSLTRGYEYQNHLQLPAGSWCDEAVWPSSIFRYNQPYAARASASADRAQRRPPTRDPVWLSCKPRGNPRQGASSLADDMPREAVLAGARQVSRDDPVVRYAGGCPPL